MTAPIHAGEFEAIVRGGERRKITCTYTVKDQAVRLTIPFCEFESKNTKLSIAGLPDELRPAAAIERIAFAQNNGMPVDARAVINPNKPGSIVFTLNGNADGWASTGRKGLGVANKGLFEDSPTVYSDVPMGWGLSA